MDDSLELSQHSLQDFVDCNLRFKLRYLDHLAWPAARTDDQLKYELHQRQGVDFHRLVQQWINGIPRELLENNLRDADVLIWWQSFTQAVQQFPELEPSAGARRLAEYTLSARLAGRRLMAKFDLLVVVPDGGVKIFDWKTGHQPQPAHRFSARIQTRVYRYLAAAALPGIQPEQVEMIYWQTAAPHDPIHLPYSADQMQTDRQVLGDLIGQIQSLGSDQFLQTANQKQCEYCVYRSYCQRGNQPGSQAAWDASATDEIDLSDIQPIEY